MIANVHDLIIKVDKRLIDEIEINKQKLYLAADYDIYKNTKITAEVVSVPHKLKDVVLYLEAEGWPPYHGKRDKDGKNYPTTYQPRYITMGKQPIEVRRGDTVYFHYLTLSDNNFLGHDADGMELYKCGYDQLFCYVRDGAIKMINGWMAVEPMKDESYEDIEIDELDMFNRKVGTRKMGVKMSKSGIIYDTNNKPVFRHGIIKMSGTPPDGNDYPVKEGDTIIYSDFSEFKNTIEGVEYFMMKIFDSVAYYKGGKIIPVGYYCMVDVTENQSSILIIPDKYKRKNDEGVVLKKGGFVRELEVGYEVRFNEKEAYRVPIEDRTLCFIREQEVWGYKI